MIDFIDLEGNRHGAITEYSVRHGVNGEKSLSGTVYTNEEVIHGIDKGWRLEVNNEFYVVTFGVPVDTGNRTQLEFDAVHEFFYEMSKDVVYDTLSGSNTATRYLNFIFDGSGYEYRLEIDVPAFSKDNFGMENRLALFKDFVQTTGVEFVVNNRVVRILREVGSDLSTIVKKGFNLQELRLEKNMSEFVTVKRGYGAFFDDENPEAGRLEVEYKSPLVEIFGELHADPIVDERFSVPENLEERLKEDVENSYNISVQLTMEDLTKAGYEYERPETGDYILAMNEDLGFEQRVRIVSYESHYDVEGNIIDHDVTCNSIGVAQRSTGSAGFRNTINRALENAERALEIANHAQVSADGNTMNYYGETDPRELGYEVRLGDTWFQVSGEDRIIQTWNGAEWEPLINTAHTDEVSKRVDEALEEARDAKTQVEREAEERRADIQAESERLSSEWNERIEENEQIVEGIRHSTEELMDDFDRALTQAGFTTFEDLTTTLNTRSLEAIENARESIEIAERADGYALEALDVANGIGTRMTDVESTVEEQVTSINTAIATAERVEQELIRVEDVAEGARVVANRVEETAEGWSREISELTNDVDDLSSRFVSIEANVEGITNTVSDYEGRISRTEQRADGLYDVVHDPNEGLLTEVTQLAEGWQVTAGRLDELSVGGNNLISGTKDMSGNRNSARVTNDTYNGFTIARSPNSNSRDTTLFQTNTEMNGDKYTVSFYARAEEERVIECFFYEPNTTTGAITSEGTDTSTGGDGRVEVPITTEWKRYWITWTHNPRESLKAVIIGRNNRNTWVEVAGVMMTSGTLPMDWGPAYEDMATQADITVLYNAIDLAVQEGDVIGRLNIQAGHTLIQNGEILMDADTVRFTGSAFIPNAAIEEVSANKIIGNDGQFNTLRSRFLTSNLIESDHLNVTTAMIDRLFANSALIERLTSQQAFIDQLSASNLEIDGGRVHGTLDGNSLNFVNIDVNSLSGNTSEFVKTQWNNAAGNSVSLSGDGLVSTQGGHTMTLDAAQIIATSDNSRLEISPIAISGSANSNWWEVSATGIHMNEAGGRNTILNGRDLIFLNGSRQIGMIRFSTLSDVSEGLVFYSNGNEEAIGLGNYISLIKDVDVRDNIIRNFRRLEIGNGGYLLRGTGGPWGDVASFIGNRPITLGRGSPSSWQDRMIVDGNINVLTNIDMRGNRIANDSDARLKYDIETTDKDAISIFEKIRIVDFKWKESGQQDFGVIAQEMQDILPESVARISDDNDYLSIYDDVVNKHNWLATQQLIKEHKALDRREENTNKIASHAYLMTEQHEDELECLKCEVKELKEEVEELRGMVA